MAAPLTRPLTSNSICVNLPKREELSLRTVLALPNASRRGLDSRTCASAGLSFWGKVLREVSEFVLLAAVRLTALGRMCHGMRESKQVCAHGMVCCS